MIYRKTFSTFSLLLFLGLLFLVLNPQISRADWNSGGWFNYVSSTSNFVPTHTWYSQGFLQVWSATGTFLGYTGSVSGEVQGDGFMFFGGAGTASSPFVHNTYPAPIILPTSTLAGYVSYVVNGTVSCSYGANIADLATWEANCEDGQSQLSSIFLTPPTTITLDFPVNSSTTIPDFTNWVIETSYARAGNLSIHYGLVGSGFPYVDSISYSPFVNTNPLAIYKTQALWFPPLSVPANWQSYAELDMATSSVSSSIASFYIDPNAPNPTSTATTTRLAAPFSSLGGGGTSSTIPITTNCQYTSSSFLGDPVGNIQQGICQALTFLFVPNDAQQQDISSRFGTIKNVISTKPPIGYFTAIQTDFNGLALGSSSVQLMDSSTSAALSPVFGTIDTGLAYMLWLLFGFWIFHRVRNFDFHA
jgi:hypothetical protein